MAFSAAELQKRHGLEGAPDPFPTLGNAPTPKSNGPKSNGASNGSNGDSSSSAPAVDSVDAFPSLGSSAAPAQSIAQPAASLWAKGPSSIKTSKSKATAPGGLGRSGAPTANSHPFSDTFSMPSADVATGKTLSDTLKKVQDQTGAIVESATQMATGLKTFYIKAADQKRLTYARRMIERGLSKPVTIEVEVPISTLGTIIGPKGSTLKGITDSTQCKIDIPRRDTLPAYEPKEKADEDDEDEDEDDEPQVNITVSGPSAACADAKAKILGLISHKVSQSSASIKNIPSSFYPFIAGPKGSKVRELEERYGDVKIHVPPPAVWKALEKQGEEDEGAVERDVSIKIKGDKENVKAVVALIQNQYKDLSEQMRELKISIPKRQHRFLVGSTADGILSQTQCIVELPSVEDASDVCVIRGPQAGLIPALTIVMDEANKVAVETVDVVALHRSGGSDALAHAKRIVRFFQRSQKLRQLASEGVKIFPPFASTISSSGNVVIDIVGEDKAAVAKAKEQVTQLVKSLPPSSVTTVEIDSLVHALLIGKKGAKIAQFESAQSVTTVFPAQAEESSEVVLVYTGSSTDKKATASALDAASAALQELARGAADMKTETLDVDKKWHRAIIGPGGTVLNALIGEDQAVLVKVGAKADDGSNANEDVVTVRGPSSEVDRVISQIKQIVEDAKNDDIINGFTAELSVDKKHVPHLVGQGGSTINKLRETLGVKVNFDDAEDKKGKKTVACKIVGRKEAVEEAKKRIIAQIEKLEDETTETITIKRAIQPALIGSSGKYAIRLEEKYGVKLSFPRESKDGTAPSNPDEVVIRGGKKGVAAVKAELLEAAAFETESRQSLTFTIPTRAVAQVVGKGGQVINGIKDESGAQIDIDKNGEGGKTTITCRGDKKAIAAAKAAILAVSDSVGEETSAEISVPQKYHRSLIGQGGQKLRDLIVSCGGPEETFRQSGLITFPRQGNEDMDTVKLRGEKGLVAKIKAELEKQVKQLKETKIEGVVVPKDQHASKIGRGGMALQSLQRESGATIHFPGSRQYGSVGEIENDLPAETDAADIVKVIGTKEAIAKAKESLERAPRENTGRGTPDQASRSLSIPKKYYHALADQQNLLRQIRSAGGYLTIPQPAPPKPSHKPSATANSAAKSARIDADGDEGAQPEEGNWEVRENHTEGAEGDETIDWVVRGKEEDLDKAVAVLQAALDGAKAATHVGLLTGLPRSAFPRIIGTKGATISRLRSDTGADIQVGKDDDLITITGDESSVNQAKDAILAIVQRPSGGQRY